MSVQGFTRLCVLATLLGLIVAVFGAYVRLSHAGLSCPDWPGCYGQVAVPVQAQDVARANAAYPQRAVDVPRAWMEMVHRYLAGLLAVLIVVLAVVAWRRRNRPGQQLALPMAAVVLVALQVLLGMWSVTLLLKPIVVTAHLLVGFTIAALLWWLALRHGGLFTGYARPLLGTGTAAYAPWVLLGLVLLYLQLFLGGWVSSNYAALACPDFPLCQGQLVPPLDLENAMRPWRGLGVSYEGGVLENDARVTIHVLHRLGALVLLAYLGILSLRLMRGPHDRRLRSAGGVLALVLLVQIGLGIGNVQLGLPLVVAVAHNAGAAVLLLTLVTVYHVIRPPKSAV